MTVTTKALTKPKRKDTSVRRDPTSRRARKVNALTFSIMCKLLIEGTRTARELADDTGLHVLTVYDWLAAMHAQEVIHVCDWEGEGRSAMRIFKLGPGKDAPRPVKGRKQAYADYRARKRAAALNQRMAGAAPCTPTTTV